MKKKMFKSINEKYVCFNKHLLKYKNKIEKNYIILSLNDLNYYFFDNLSFNILELIEENDTFYVLYKRLKDKNDINYETFFNFVMNLKEKKIIKLHSRRKTNEKSIK